MKKYLFAFLPLVISVSCAGLFFAFAPAATKAEKKTPQASPTARVGASMTATATPTPQATPDYRQVWPAQTQAAAADLLAQHALQAARAEATKASAASTLVQATLASHQNALLEGTPTAIARATAIAERTEQAAATAQAAFAQREHARILATIESQRKAAETRQNVTFAVWVAGLAAVVIVVLYVAQTWAYNAQAKAWQAKAESVAQNLLDNISPPSDFIPVSQARSDSARVKVDPDTFTVWASRMLAGATAGINKWEGADSPFYGKRAAYAPFLVEMERRGYVADKPGQGKVLTEIGKKFCEGWLARRQAGETNN